MIVAARVVHSTDVVEINTYEQLREIDSDSNQLKTDAIRLICKALCAKPEEVTDITVLKKGMTNRSFLFTCKDKKYIMRIPGEGTDQLINAVRKQRYIMPLLIKTSVMISPILTRKMAIRLQSFWRAPGYATPPIMKMSRSA